MNEEALKARLKYIAAEKNTTFNFIWKQLLLERFLARLSSSQYRDKFIFKGGLLLATYVDICRETIDIDFLIRNLNREKENIESVLRNISSIDTNDGVHYNFVRTEQLEQHHMEYTGIRAFLDAGFGKMKDRIQIDIGIGDYVSAEEKIYNPFEYKGMPIFSGEIMLQVYPVETIFSEKLETIISRGAVNSRMKDYHDVLIIIRESNLINKKKLNLSVKKTFSNRGSRLVLPIKFDGIDVEGLQRYWSAHLRGLGDLKEKLNLPERFIDVVDEVNNYLMPVLQTVETT